VRGAASLLRSVSSSRYTLLSLSERISQRKRCNASSTAGCSEHQVNGFTVTHPFHPAIGQRYELLERRKNWGEDRVFFYNAEGRHQSLPAAWTDLGELHLFVAATGGRSCFCAAAMLDLVRLVEALGQRPKAADRV
jgi:Family of unknown function (DUF5372)